MFLKKYQQKKQGSWAYQLVKYATRKIFMLVMLPLTIKPRVKIYQFNVKE